MKFLIIKSEWIVMGSYKFHLKGSNENYPLFDANKYIENCIFGSSKNWKFSW